MRMADWHVEEDRARRELQRKAPNHPALKKFYPSTHEAVEAYWKALRELELEIQEI